MTDGLAEGQRNPMKKGKETTGDLEGCFFQLLVLNCACSTQA